MKALTLWAPWSWAVASGIKRVENRPWAPPANMIGERFAIHTAKYIDPVGTGFLEKNGVVVPTEAYDVLGAIVGVARVVGFVFAGKNGERLTEATKELLADPSFADPDDQAKWFFGPYGWKLWDIQKLKRPIPTTGSQKFWTLPAHVEAALQAQLEKAA